ncbi:unnamed protein product [Sphagnum troendelagicum]|uniref:RNA-dependent RNA polymerase n=1 Tax=Sphagnum troendelagicum TaxID=128251 RepID=A0ABP0U174_9BRYO
MQGVWKLVSWATGKGEEEEGGGGGGVVKSDGENEVTFKADGDSFGFSSPVSWTQDGAAEEFEDAAYELAAKNESEGSTRRTANRSVRSTQGQLLRDDEESPQYSDEGGLQGSLSAELDDEPEDPLHQRFRDFHLSHQLATGLHRESGLPKSQSYASSRSLRSKNVVVLSGGEDGAPEQIQGGMSKTKGVKSPPRKLASFYSNGLKQIQLQKLEKLKELDKDWDTWFPEVREEPYVWPWTTLTEQQVALGQLDFKKFLVVLSCLGELKLKPEEVLNIDQIRNIKSMPLEEVAEYTCREVAIQKSIRPESFPVVNRAWLKKNEPVSFECNVDRFGNYKFKVVEPRQVSTLLHRTFGADRVMPVYFDQPPPAHDQFRIVRDGILVGLRRYRFWAFKDSGKEDFKKRNKAGAKDYQRAVKCYFICTESLADIDLNDPNFKYFTQVHAARCHIMHIHTVPTMAKFASRLQLALSKSATAGINLTRVDIEVKMIEDVRCKIVDDSGKPMSHTDGTGQISPDVAKLLPSSVLKGKVDNKEGHPTLVQIHMFWHGEAIKGTFQVNQKLKGLKIYYRESMKKVSADDVLRDFSTVNSLAILNTSHKPKEAHLSQDLIVLLSIGNVPASFFIELVKKALDNVCNMFKQWELAYKEVENCTQGIGEQTYRMLESGFPMNHPQVQKNLRLLAQDRIVDIRKGCVPLPGSFYLMGTSDPTEKKVLKHHQVAISMGEGKILGKVLVYKSPGKHWGDVHLFEAIWDSRLDPYVSASKYTIFFSVQGERPVVDEIANSDLDGDLYWVCNNEQLISHFTPSPPWKRLGGKINYPEDDRPDNLTPEQLEKALFKKFLKARFQTFRPMPTAANYWLAHMDRYLTLKDNPDPQDEMSLISESIDDLIEIFYRALDADKTGEEVQLPARLKPVVWPHFMDKKENDKRVYYKSSSVLGQIYDLADISTDNLGYSHQETMNYDPKFEYERFDKYVEKWRGLLQVYNKEMQGAAKDKQNDIIARYQKILIGDGKPLSQIWEEASALYVANHEHAVMTMKKGHPPSLQFAMSVALMHLCDIYSRNVSGGAPPYSRAASVRNKILQHS